MSLDRREVLIGGLLTVSWMPAISTVCGAQDPSAHHGRGCVVAATSLRPYLSRETDVVLRFTGNEPIISKSGNPIFDRALAITLVKLTRAFDALPGFGYFQESPNENPNAMALPYARLANPDGTVLFGRRLLDKLLALPDHPEVSVTAVCAHEWGHILQYKRGLRDRLLADSSTVKPMELHADYLAGYFAGLRRRDNPGYPAAVIALTQYNVGDPYNYSPDHHGTKKERGAAVVAGFEAAYHHNRPLDEAVEAGIGLARSSG